MGYRADSSKSSSPTAIAGAENRLAEGGEMGKLIRSMDWSKTPLGPIESWPESLRTTVRAVADALAPELELAQVRGEWAKELEQANRELEAFSYSISHDLCAPLRAIEGFSKALLHEYGDRLDEQGSRYLDRVRAAAQRMATLIDGLLNLSRISRASLRKERVSLTELARGAATALRERDPSRSVSIEIAGGLQAYCDALLIAIVFENLIGNAWKFTASQPQAQIAVGQEKEGNETIFFVRDNGAGFNMAYADRLFAPFQRLHGEREFEGTGIGLATVQRIISRHRGRIWAEAETGKGATFRFTLENPR
jgi:light-regulated signal transduction histidine kinase (bacteriophytochrome)